jgi:ABC-type nitrate/sulfonate/bicarbonate transport system substrate-binding protein
MTAELKELRQHVRWLEDEVSNATAVDDALDKIEICLEAINDTLEKHANELEQLVDAINRAGDFINRNSDVLQKLVEVLATPKPQPSMGDAVFKPSEPKQRAAKPKPRKPKLSVVSKDSDDGPGAAS